MCDNIGEQIFSKRQEDSIISTIDKIKSIKTIKQFYKLLYDISYNRFETAKIINNYTEIKEPDDILNQFGRSRVLNSEWGLHYNNIEKPIENIVEMYYPKYHKLTSKYEALITPIFKKYNMYLEKLKKICIYNSIDLVFNKMNILKEYKGLTNIIAIDILNKSNSGIHIVEYDKKPLTIMYYEKDTEMINTIEKYGNDKHLSSNILLYRAIYHTAPEFHSLLLDNCFKIILDSKNQGQQEIATVFWLLAQATLYERGSASITEIICSAMMSILQNKKVKIKCKNENLYLDIEAMSMSLENFLLYWQNNINKFCVDFEYNYISNCSYNNKVVKDKSNTNISNCLTLDLQEEFKC